MVGQVHIEAIQLTLLVIFVLVALVAGLARRINISYPIVLVLAGLAASLLPHMPRISLEPGLVFLVFLPPLLFAAAWQTSWRDFRQNIFSISMLAIGLVGFTVWISAWTAHFFIRELDWGAGFLLGAVVSPTDAVAATSIARRLGLPRRIVDVLEGESLINDATGLLALEFGLLLVSKQATPTPTEAAIRFVWLLGGGVVIGLAIAWIVAWFERWVNDGPVEIIISLLVPYAAYLAAESVHASGIIAVVACGLYLGRHSASFFSSNTRLQANSVWDVTVFLLNGLVFVFIGLQLPFVLEGLAGYSIPALIGYGVGFSLMLIAVRVGWVFLFTPIAVKLRVRVLHLPYDPPTPRQKFIIGWTGMRGVVALAAAVSIPYSFSTVGDFPARNIIVFLTYIVILVTLVAQGLTLPAIIKMLAVAAAPGTDCEETDARKAILEAAIEYLKNERVDATETYAHTLDDLMHQYEHRLEELIGCGEPSESNNHHRLHATALRTVQVQRAKLIEMRDENRISDETLRGLERELDLSESRLIRVGAGEES